MAELSVLYDREGRTFPEDPPRRLTPGARAGA